MHTTFSGENTAMTSADDLAEADDNFHECQ